MESFSFGILPLQPNGFFQSMLLFNHILLGIVDGFCYSLVVDASTFGFRPALDEFLLTICDICGAVIKPQALRSHIGKNKHPSFMSSHCSPRIF